MERKNMFKRRKVLAKLNLISGCQRAITNTPEQTMSHIPYPKIIFPEDPYCINRIANEISGLVHT